MYYPNNNLGNSESADFADSSQLSGTSPTIVIADDDQSLVRIMSMRFRARGWNVLTAFDGQSAQDLIAVNDPDLVMLDINLPLGNGLLICRELRAQNSTVDLPVIILTGQTDAATENQCRDLKAKLVRKGGQVWPNIEAVLEQSFSLC